MQQPHDKHARRIVFIRDDSDLDRVKDNQGEDLFLTSSMPAYIRLRNQGHEVTGTWDYITGDMRRQIVIDATNLKDHWYDELRDSLTYRGINMAEAFQFPLFHFLWEALASARVAEQLIKLTSPGEISLSGVSEIPARYSLAVRSDVPEAIFAYYANVLGVPVSWAGKRGDRVRTSVSSLLRRSVPAPVRRIVRRLREWSSKQERSDAHEFDGLSEAISSLHKEEGKYTAIAASAYQGLLMLMPIADHLEQRGDWSTLLVHTGHHLDLASTLKDPRASDYLLSNRSRPFKYLEIFKAARNDRRVHNEFTNHAWRRFLDWQANYQGDYPQIFANPELEFQFRYLLVDLMGELCRVVDAAYDIFQQDRPDVVLVGNVSEKDLTVSAVARVLNRPSVLVPHNLGWASPEDYEYPVDYIAVQNEGTARFLKGIVGSRQLLVVGNLKPKKSDLPEEIKPHAQPSGTEHTRILVLIGGFTPGVFQNCNPGAFYSSLEALITYLDKRTDWKVIFRAHPRLESFKWLKDLVQHTQGFISGQLILETNAVAEEIIPEVDLVLMLDYRSSPAIAAWKNGVPIIRWASSTLLYSLNDMFREDWFPQVTNCSELEQMIHRFISDDEWRNQWISKGHALTNKYFSAPELPETILADMLTKICKENLGDKTGAGDHPGH